AVNATSLRSSPTPPEPWLPSVASHPRSWQRSPPKISTACSRRHTEPRRPDIIESDKETEGKYGIRQQLRRSQQSRASGSEERDRSGIQRSPCPLRPQGFKVEDRTRRH